MVKGVLYNDARDVSSEANEGGHNKQDAEQKDDGHERAAEEEQEDAGEGQERDKYLEDSCIDEDGKHTETEHENV